MERVLRAQYCSSSVGCSCRASGGVIVLSQCLQCLHLLEELLLDSLRGGDGAHHDLPVGVVGGTEEDVVLDGLPAVVPTGGALPGEVLLTGPEVVGQHPSGTQVAPKWHPSGTHV